MSDLAYLIGHPEPLRFSPDIRGNYTVWDGVWRIPFQRIEETLVQEGYNLPAKIKHLLVDAKFPFQEFRLLDSGIFSPLPRGDPDRGHPTQYSDYRYRTIVVSGQLTMGDLLGYSVRADRKRQLSKSVRAYTARGEYEYLRGERLRGFSPPYFALTSLESVNEVKEVFEELGIEVKLVDVPNRQNLVAPSITPIQLEQVEGWVPYDPAVARNVREKVGMNRHELARHLGFLEQVRYAGSVIESYESGRKIPQPYSKNKVARKYFEWLKEHGYDPFDLRFAKVHQDRRQTRSIEHEAKVKFAQSLRSLGRSAQRIDITKGVLEGLIAERLSIGEMVARLNAHYNVVQRLLTKFGLRELYHKSRD